MADKYSSVAIVGSVPRRSRWMDVESTAFDQIRIAVMDNLSGTLTIEGSDDASVIVAENADNPTYSDDSAATFTDITSTISFSSSLTVSDECVITGSYTGSKKYIRVRWVPTAGTGRIVVTVSGMVADGDGDPNVTMPDGSPVEAQRVNLSVRDYTPILGGIRQPLDQDNFQDAFDACLQDAFARSADLSQSGINYRAGYAVYVPEGIWPLSRAPWFRGTGIAAPIPVTPALRGAGIGRTWLKTTSDFQAANGAAIRVGGDKGDSDDSYTYRWEMSDIGLVSHAHEAPNLCGVHIQIAYAPLMRRVHIEGFLGVQTNPVLNCGLKIDTIEGNPRNNQHVFLDNVWIQGNTIGAKFQACTPVTLNHCTVNQNAFVDVVHDSSLVNMYGGTLQGGGDPGNNYAFRTSKGMSRMVSGWAEEFDPGASAAAIGTATGDETVVTGLVGVTADWRHRWLYLERATTPFDGADKVSGYYLITRYISSTSVGIRKGSNHTAATNLVWRVLHGADSFVSLHGVYHENACFALVGAYVTEDASATLALKDCHAANADYVVEALGCSGAFSAATHIERCYNRNSGMVKARWCQSVICPDVAHTAIGDLDTASVEGYVGRANSYLNFGSYALAGMPGGLFVGAQVVGAHRLRQICIRGGANFMLDSRATASIAKTGADVTAWTDGIGGVVGALVNATKSPQYAATDANFADQPSVTFTGDAATANTQALTFTIPAERWPETEHRPAIFAVTRIPSTGGGLRRTITMAGDSGTSWLHLYLDEASGDFKMNTSIRSGSGSTSSAVLAADTLAHAFVAGGAGRALGNVLDVDTGAAVRQLPGGYTTFDGWSGSGAKTLVLNNDFGEASDTFALVFLAIFPHGIPYQLRQQLMDAAASEFGVLGR